jgi:hypothetical protein
MLQIEAYRTIVIYDRKTFIGQATGRFSIWWREIRSIKCDKILVCPFDGLTLGQLSFNQVILSATEQWRN